MKIENSRKALLSDAFYGFMNVKDPESIRTGLVSVGKNPDVLIDDRTHEFDDQVRVVTVGLRYMKTGGILIVEDIFQSREGFAEDCYHGALASVLDYFSNVVFIECRHRNRYSPGWNNDKLLVLFRNDKTDGPT